MALRQLRELMKEKNIHAYVVPSEDAHASEYLAPCDARRAYITGFTGSAGCAIITQTDARCWTDGRYWLQAEKQLGQGWTLMKSGLPEVPTWGQWLKSNLPPSSRIGIDPTTIPYSEATSLHTSLQSPSPSPPNGMCHSSTLVPISPNLIDVVWSDTYDNDVTRPARPTNEIFHLDDKFTGESVSSKLSRLRDRLKKVGSPGMVIGSLDEIAWMFNLRGSDIPYNPVFFAYAILTKDDCTLFVNPQSLTESVRNYLHTNGIAVLDYNHIWTSLQEWQSRLKSERSVPRKDGAVNIVVNAGVNVEQVKAGDGSENGNGSGPEHSAKKQKVLDGEENENEKNEKGQNQNKDNETEAGMEKVIKTDKVLIGKKTSWAGAKAVGEDNVEVRRSIVEEFKAKKNATEIEGFRQCHIRDGVALVRYFAWLENALNNGESWTEYDAAQKLEEYRRENKWFMGLSFDTISSTGNNAAIIHYAPPKHGSAIIDKDQMYLCDSGAQYLDGTTDTTRTLHFGTPSEEEKRAFTRVLQGHISLDTVIFPQGTTGYILDILARRALWSDGMDYRHSTSHGVGSFLNVHEGPQGIGQRPAYNEVPLVEGMVISNEPGYYKYVDGPGGFGIRIENIDVVGRAETRENFGGKGWLGLERITMCPIQTSLIEINLLTPPEKKWINEYHAEVWEKISPFLRSESHAEGMKGLVGDENALKWLERECKEI